jgi:hypothetical protein
VAENFTDSRPRDRLEKLKYNIITYQPSENKGTSELSILRSFENRPVLYVTQILNISEGTLVITTKEKYYADSLSLIMSENYFSFSPAVMVHYGTDTLEITARPKGDSLEIISTDTLAISGSLPLAGNLVTGIGAMLNGRNGSFEIGHTRKYRQVNLINLTGQKFRAQAITDSVVSREKVALAIGNFDCYKVMKIMPGLIGYTYYSTDSNHIPIMIDAFDSTGTDRIMNIYLTNYE